jgi:hypothetical protein
VDPDVAEAIPELARAGVLDEKEARKLSRIASGALVSVHEELRILLYGGVLLVASGVGLLVHRNLERIGPGIVALAIGLAAASCFAWVAKHAPAFSRGETAKPHLAFDYILLLGALLAAADLAYVEVNFTPLGASWTWHLLIVAIVYAGLGFRYDSVTLFSLALTTFAAWRGLALATVARRLGFGFDERAAVEAVVLGLAFVVLGTLLERAELKRHFEPAATHLGWLLVFVGPVLRLDSGSALVWALALLVSGAGVAVLAYRAHRFWLLAMGVVAAHIGLSRFVVEAVDDFKLFLLWLIVSGLALVMGLGMVRRRGRESP